MIFLILVLDCFRMVRFDKGQCINHSGNPTLYEIRVYTSEERKPHRVALCPICVMKYNSRERVNLGDNFMPSHRPQVHDDVFVYGQDN